MLAAIGLLVSRRTMTHWNSWDLLAELFPTISVQPDAVFARDADVGTPFPKGDHDVRPA